MRRFQRMVGDAEPVARIFGNAVARRILAEHDMLADHHASEARLLGDHRKIDQPA